MNRRRLSNGREVWTVRYRDDSGSRKINRCIYLGPAPLARRARALIARWRAEAVTPRQLELRDRMFWFDLTASMRGYSRRARSRVQAEVQDTFDDPRKAVEFCRRFGRDEPLLRYGKPRGRPRRSRMW